MNMFCDENASVFVSMLAQRLVSCLSPEDSKELLVLVNLFSANLSFLIAQQLVCAPEKREGLRGDKDGEC